MKKILNTSFGSAVLGGAMVAVVGLIAISAGWIGADSGADDPSSAPLVAGATAPAASTENEAKNLINRIYRRDGQGVAFVSADIERAETQGLNPFGAPGGEEGTATGSGFLIDEEGHVITNSHVVEDATEVDVRFGDSDETLTAEVVGADPATDIALLDVDAPADELHPLALGDSDGVEVGESVIAIGNPFGLDQTVTSGIVSALQRQIEAPNGFSISHVIQTDAAINPGNSGGPLIDAEGRVIGINSQIQTGGSRGNVGIGFAVPINTAREVVSQLLESGEVEHAYLGIEGGTVTADLAEALNLPVEEGALVSRVVPGGPAAEAGLKGGKKNATVQGARVKAGGDVIVAADGEPVAGMEDVINAVNAAQPGDEITLTVRRGDATEKLDVTLGTRPDSAREAGRQGRSTPPSE